MRDLNVKTFVIVALAALAAACNTVEGAGQDIESAGEAVEKAADDSK